jgi:hypothetical protein
MDALDAEVSASGITKQMEKDLLKEHGDDKEDTTDEEDSDSDDDDDDDDQDVDDDQVEPDSEDDDEDEELEEEEELVKPKDESTEENIEVMRRQVEEELLKYTKVQETPEQNDDEVLEEDGDKLEDLHEMNKQWKPFRDRLVDPDARSVRSTSTAATIAPEDIKKRVKEAITKKDRMHKAKRIRAKGDASSANRSRRNNNDDIKSSTDAFWADD